MLKSILGGTGGQCSYLALFENSSNNTETAIKEFARLQTSRTQFYSWTVNFIE